MSPSLGVSRTATRLVLGLLAAVQVTDGLYALFAPRSFFDDFPLGRGWVEALPAYNEHLTRDVGSLFLATGVLLIAAAIYLERRLVIVALGSFLVYSVPHFVFHVLNLDGLSTGDAIAEVVSLTLTVIAPAWLLATIVSRGRGRPEPADSA